MYTILLLNKIELYEKAIFTPSYRCYTIFYIVYRTAKSSPLWRQHRNTSQSRLQAIGGNLERRWPLDVYGGNGFRLCPQNKNFQRRIKFRNYRGKYYFQRIQKKMIKEIIKYSIMEYFSLKLEIKFLKNKKHHSN